MSDEPFEVRLRRLLEGRRTELRQREAALKRRLHLPGTERELELIDDEAGFLIHVYDELLADHRRRFDLAVERTIAAARRRLDRRPR